MIIRLQDIQIEALNPAGDQPCPDCASEPALYIDLDANPGDEDWDIVTLHSGPCLSMTRGRPRLVADQRKDGAVPDVAPTIPVSAALLADLSEAASVAGMALIGHMTVIPSHPVTRALADRVGIAGDTADTLLREHAADWCERRFGQDDTSL